MAAPAYLAAVFTKNYDNREEIEEDIQRNDEIAEKFRAQYPSKLKEKLSYGAD